MAATIAQEANSGTVLSPLRISHGSSHDSPTRRCLVDRAPLGAVCIQCRDDLDSCKHMVPICDAGSHWVPCRSQGASSDSRRLYGTFLSS